MNDTERDKWESMGYGPDEVSRLSIHGVDLQSASMMRVGQPDITVGEMVRWACLAHRAGTTVTAAAWWALESWLATDDGVLDYMRLMPHDPFGAGMWHDSGYPAHIAAAMIAAGEDDPLALWRAVDECFIETAGPAGPEGGVQC